MSEYSKVLVLASTLFLAVSAFGQKAEFDSIVTLLEAHQEHDTTRVNWLMELQKYSVFDDAEEFLPYMQEANEISNEIGYGAGIGNSLNGLGVYYFQRSDYDVALDYVLRSIDVLDSLGLMEDLILPYNNLAMINNRLEHFEEAEKAYLFILEQIAPNGNTMQMAAVSNNLAVCLQTQNKFEESLPHIAKVVEIATEVKFGPGIALGEINWSKSLNGLERWDEALVHAQLAYDFALSAGMKNSKASAMRNLARSNSGLGNHAVAMAYADSAVEIFREIQQMGELFPSLYYQSEAYRAAGKADQALDIFIEFHELQDSVHSAESGRTVEAMRAKFETDEAVKDRKLAELEAGKSAAESARSRNFLFGAVGIAILILIIALLYINRMRVQKRAEMIQVESDLRESRMKAIRSQLNPHFIFNALNSIQYLFYSGDKKTASQFMSDFATLMRNVLDMSSKAEVTIAEEKKMLSHYLDLEQMRMENAFEYSIEINQNIDPENVVLPTMLLQPYVENAVKHAFQGMKEGGKIVIAVKQKGGELQVIIQDNGVGLITKEKEGSHISFSSDANAERVRMINEGRVTSVGVQMDNLVDLGEGNGTRVTINIPLT